MGSHTQQHNCCPGSKERKLCCCMLGDTSSTTLARAATEAMICTKFRAREMQHSRTHRRLSAKHRVGCSNKAVHSKELLLPHCSKQKQVPTDCCCCRTRYTLKPAAAETLVMPYTHSSNSWPLSCMTHTTHTILALGQLHEHTQPHRSCIQPTGDACRCMQPNCTGMHQHTQPHCPCI